MFGIFWNPIEQSDDENTRWAWLRAMEWSKFPLFIAQPIVPILFIFIEWWRVIIFFILLTWIWALFRYRYINLVLLDLGSLFVHLKWPISIGVGIYFLTNNNYFLGVLSGLWPLFSLLFQLLTPPVQIGVLQKSILMKLGYVPNEEENQNF
jgi:hypothetical protein